MSKNQFLSYFAKTSLLVTLFKENSFEFKRFMLKKKLETRQLAMAISREGRKLMSYIFIIDKATEVIFVTLAMLENEGQL